jgi:hypothetical protein
LYHACTAGRLTELTCKHNIAALKWLQTDRLASAQVDVACNGGAVLH